MLGVTASLIGVGWLAATVLLASAAYHHLRGAHGRAMRDRGRAGWLAAAAAATSIITIAVGSL